MIARDARPSAEMTPRLGFGSVVPLARRMVLHDRNRFAITIAGVAVAVMLMLFLLALYVGVHTESNGYVADRSVAGWIAQDNTNNFIKSQSIVFLHTADTLRTVPGVAEVSPLVRLITEIEISTQRTSAIVVGIDPLSTIGRPAVVAGSDVLTDGSIILDQAMARRIGAHVGDTLRSQGRPFIVIGLSRGTNMVLTQIAFITHADASDLVGFPGVTSFFLVRAVPGVEWDAIAPEMRARAPTLRAIPQGEFAENNMEELRGGLLPILATVAVLGGINAAAVLALMLFGSVLERREDYALLKAIGAPARMVALLVVRQALGAVVGGCLAGIAAYYIAAPLVLRLVPAMLLALSARSVLTVVAGALLVGLVAALWPLQRMARIHPSEVFRA